MTLHQSIERQERELQELLQKVMQAPLSPITDSVLELKERMDELEQQVREMRETELSALNLATVDTHKQIRSLKNITVEIPQEVRGTLQPLLEQFQAQLEQKAQQRIHQLATDLHADSESLLGVVGCHLAEHSAEGQRSVVRVKDLLSLHKQELSQQSASGFRQLSDDAHARMSQLTQSMAHLEAQLIVQQQQLGYLQQQQISYSKSLKKHMEPALLSLKKWAIASVCVAAASSVSVVALAYAAGHL